VTVARCGAPIVCRVPRPDRRRRLRCRVHPPGRRHAREPRRRRRLVTASSARLPACGIASRRCRDGMACASDELRERRRHQGRLPHSPSEAAAGRVAGDTGRPRWAGHSFARRLRGQAEARKELREYEGGFPSCARLERENVERREGAVHQGDGRRRDSATSRAETPSTSRRKSTARLAREKVLERRGVVAVALVVPDRRVDHRGARTRALVAATSCISTSGRCSLDHRANARALGRGVASCPASAEKESKWR
jgi:hypothetical protein